MKKTLITILLAFMACVAVNAQLMVGVTGGARLNRLDGARNLSEPQQMSTSFSGFVAGLKMDYNSPIGLGFDFSVLYASKNQEQYDETGLEVPINIKYNFNMVPVMTPYLLAGVSCFSTFDNLRHTIDSWGNTETWADRIELSANIGLGFTIVNHYQIGLTYQHPIGTYIFMDDEFQPNTYAKRAHNWVVSVGYLF